MRFKDISNSDLKPLAINTDTWEALASDRGAWRQAVPIGGLSVYGSDT